jgi:ABC-type multidrug transport system fused ATPase/permease subunit
MARMLGDVNEVQNSFFFNRISIKELTIVFALVTMFIISTKLTLFVLIFMPISGSFQKLLKFESTIITGTKRKWVLDFYCR